MTWFWLAILSALLSAAAAILQKKALHDLKALDFTLLMSAFAAVLSAPLFAITDFSNLNTLSFLYLFIKSVLNALAFLCIMTALKNLDLGRTLPILASSPMVIALLAFIFLGEDLKLIEVAGMMLIVIGTYILELKKNESFLYPFLVFKKSGYHRIIIAALLLMSVSSVMDKFILVKFKLPPVLFVAVQNYIFFVIFFLIFMFIRLRSGTGFSFSLFAKNKSSLLFVIFVISILTIGYRLAQIEAVKLAPVGIVISLKRLSVLFAVLIGARIFKEESYLKKIFVTILIVAGAMMIYED
ncbi:MAG: DMT family transporter [Ignavibacteria bacterium]